MNNKYSKHILIIIIVLVFLFRLYFSFQINGFSDDISYETLSRINNILENPLSFHFSSSFIYDYLMSFIYLLSGDIGLKIITNLFAVLIIYVNYKISMCITENDYSSLLVALISGFIPVFVIDSYNSIQPFHLFFLLFVIQLYNFINIKSKIDVHFYNFIFLIIIMPFISPLSILISFSLIAFILFAGIEKLEVTKTKIDLIIFSSIYLIWTQFLTFKAFFIKHGVDIIYQNIPSTLLNNYFIGTNLSSMIIEIGFIPFFFGVFIIYFFIFKKQRFLLSLFPFFLVLLFLIIFKLIDLTVGLILIGELFVLFFMFFFRVFSDYLKNSKFIKFWPVFIIGFFFVFFVTSIVPISLELNQSTNDVIIEKRSGLYSGLSGLEGTVFSTAEYGSLINSATKTNSVITIDYLNYNNPQKILGDIDSVYSAINLITVIDILKKYDANYILINEKILNKYKLSEFRFENDFCVSETKAFVLVYDDGFNKIFKLNCGVSND